MKIFRLSYSSRHIFSWITYYHVIHVYFSVNFRLFSFTLSLSLILSRRRKLWFDKVCISFSICCWSSLILFDSVNRVFKLQFEFCENATTALLDINIMSELNWRLNQSRNVAWKWIAWSAMNLEFFLRFESVIFETWHRFWSWSMSSSCF